MKAHFHKPSKTLLIMNIRCYDELNHTVFWTVRRTPLFWEENGDVSYNPNVAYLTRLGGGGQGFFVLFISYFPPLKPRYILWSGASHSPKHTVLG